MLQFITKASPRFSVPDQVEMAIKGGCRWIQLSADSIDDKETSMKHMAEKLIPVCRDANNFLILEDDVELVKLLKVHGVFLHDDTRSSVAQARENLGANAVLGVLASDKQNIADLRGLDVDYVMVPAGILEPSDSIGAGYAAFISYLRNAGVDFHIVACGEISPGEYAAVMKAGVAGVAVSGEIADAADPIAKTEEIMEALDNARMAAESADPDMV